MTQERQEKCQGNVKRRANTGKECNRHFPQGSSDLLQVPNAYT